MESNFIELAELIDRINGTLYMFIGLFIVFFSWFILVGIPAFAFLNIYKNTKEEAIRNGDGSSLIHIKTGFMTTIVVAIVSMMYFFVFVNILQVEKTAGQVVKTVLRIEPSSISNNAKAKPIVGGNKKVKPIIDGSKSAIQTNSPIPKFKSKQERAEWVWEQFLKKRNKEREAKEKIRRSNLTSTQREAEDKRKAETQKSGEEIKRIARENYQKEVAERKRKKEKEAEEKRKKEEIERARKIVEDTKPLPRLRPDTAEEREAERLYLQRIRNLQK